MNLSKRQVTLPEAKIQKSAAASSTKSRILVATFAFNEGTKIQTTVKRILAATSEDVLVMNDGSTDGSIDKLRSHPLHVLSNAHNMGIGASMKRVFQYALDSGYEILVIMAGNNKDDPSEVSRLVQPIVEQGYDFVQGSRFLLGAEYGNMPLYRRFATRLHPFLFSLAVRKRISESTNGFRAFRTAILRDRRIDWRQAWLDKYELEPYLLFKVITLGYRHTEVPVTKIYPPKAMGYTKMKAVTGWWSILSPIVFLGLRIKK